MSTPHKEHFNYPLKLLILSEKKKYKLLTQVEMGSNCQNLIV